VVTFKRPNKIVLLVQVATLVAFLAVGLVSFFNHSDTVYAASRTCDGGRAIGGITAPSGLLPSIFSQTPSVCVGDFPQFNNYYLQVEVKAPYDVDGESLAKKATVKVTYNGGNSVLGMTVIGTADFISTEALIIPIDGGGCHPTTPLLISVTVMATGAADKTVSNIDVCSSNRTPSGNDPATFTNHVTVDVPEFTPRSSGNPGISKQHIIGFIGADFGAPISTDATSQYHALQKSAVSSLSLKKSDGTVVFSCSGGCDGKDGLKLADGEFGINTSDNPTIGLGTYDLTFVYNTRTLVPNAPDEWAPHTFTFLGIKVNEAGKDVNITPDASLGNLQYYDKDGKATKVGTGDPIVKPEAAGCTGGALGWIMCPIMKVFESANRFMAPEIEKQLKVGPLVAGDPTYAGTYPIWQTMVGIANLLLVVGFLVVIFSQATSIGLSAYGIKKMLPRIIAAAILLNLSYFICAITLDIVNIIGASIQGIINIGTSGIKNISGFKTDFGDILTTLGLGVLGTYAVISGALAFLVPLGLTAIMSVLVIFLGLALRKVMIILLIIIAPIAFAAMILPGTEGLFKKWYKSLGGLLVMYPVVMAMLYGSTLLAKIILASGGVATVDGAIDTSGTGNINIMIAYAVVALGPLAGTYMFIKSSNKMFSAAAGAINKLGAGAKGKASTWAKEKQQNSQFSQARNFNKAVKDSKRVERQGVMEGDTARARFNRTMSLGAGIGNRQKYYRSATNKAAAYSDKIFAEDMESAAAKFEARGIQGPPMVAIAASGKDGTRTLTTAEHAAAINWVMENGKFSERMQVYGAGWANEGDDNEDTHRKLQTARAGYFKKGDNQFMGVSYAGLLAQGHAGGAVGVENAMLSNAIDGKIGAETGLDNDYMDTMVKIFSEDPAQLAQRHRYGTATIDGKTQLSPLPLRPRDGEEPSDIEKFQENIKSAALATLTNDNTQQRVKEEFRPKLEMLAGLEKGSTKPKPPTPPPAATP